MDENGTVEMELPCSMRGWPHLRPGTKLRGRLEDCHNKWGKFDGNTPHMTMPYTGEMADFASNVGEVLASASSSLRDEERVFRRSDLLGVQVG